LSARRHFLVHSLHQILFAANAVFIAKIEAHFFGAFLQYFELLLLERIEAHSAVLVIDGLDVRIAARFEQCLRGRAQHVLQSGPIDAQPARLLEQAVEREHALAASGPQRCAQRRELLAVTLSELDEARFQLRLCAARLLDFREQETETLLLER
jgi:hypothetical protein